MTFTLACERDAVRHRQWQQSVYDSIMAAYRERKAAHDTQVAFNVQEAQYVNPATHDTIVRTEIKRATLDVLRAGPVVGPSPDLLTIDGAHVRVENLLDVQDDIQFFEQAFEWPEVTYVLYPYYWGRHPDTSPEGQNDAESDWTALLAESDDDVVYAQFLGAGAARVVVPVRPHFEHAALFYLATGVVWNGSDVPAIGDPLYLAAVDEIRSAQDLGGGTPVGDSWEVRLPTSQVILAQGVEALADITGPEPPPQTPVAVGIAPLVRFDQLDGIAIPATAGAAGAFGAQGPSRPAASWPLPTSRCKHRTTRTTAGCDGQSTRSTRQSRGIARRSGTPTSSSSCREGLRISSSWCARPTSARRPTPAASSTSRPESSTCSSSHPATPSRSAGPTRSDTRRGCIRRHDPSQHPPRTRPRRWSRRSSRASSTRCCRRGRCSRQAGRRWRDCSRRG
jgi:hypothetical protein